MEQWINGINDKMKTLWRATVAMMIVVSLGQAKEITLLNVSYDPTHVLRTE